MYFELMYFELTPNNSEKSFYSYILLINFVKHNNFNQINNYFVFKTNLLYQLPNI